MKHYRPTFFSISLLFGASALPAKYTAFSCDNHLQTLYPEQIQFSTIICYLRNFEKRRLHFSSKRWSRYFLKNGLIWYQTFLDQLCSISGRLRGLRKLFTDVEQNVPIILKCLPLQQNVFSKNDTTSTKSFSTEKPPWILLQSALNALIIGFQEAYYLCRKNSPLATKCIFSSIVRLHLFLQKWRIQVSNKNEAFIQCKKMVSYDIENFALYTSCTIAPLRRSIALLLLKWVINVWEVLFRCRHKMDYLTTVSLMINRRVRKRL